MNKTGKGGFKDHPEHRRNGRPRKENSITDLLNKYGKKQDYETKGQKTSRIQALVEKTWEMALKDNDPHILKYIYDRIDGRPTESIHIHNEQDAEWLAWLKDVQAGVKPETDGDSNGLLAEESETSDS